MHGLIRNMIPLTICISLGLGAATAFAENKCKGLSQSTCSAGASCSWVNGYETKKGKKVDAYCRVKSGKKKGAEMAPETTN